LNTRAIEALSLAVGVGDHETHPPRPGPTTQERGPEHLVFADDDVDAEDDAVAVCDQPA
jgi:hypothetical protein